MLYKITKKIKRSFGRFLSKIYHQLDRAVAEYYAKSKRPLVREYILSKFFPDPNRSFQRHNSEYEEEKSFEREKSNYEDYKKRNCFNGPESKYEDFIKSHPEVRELAIDIGSGCGWLSVELSRFFKKVIGIEPSKKAVVIAEQLKPVQCKNIEYVNTYAEEGLDKLSIPCKALFVTGCVLGHLPDETVSKICQAVEKKALPGSLLVFAEAWGKEFHAPMWNARTKEWWQANLPSWKIDFLKYNRPEDRPNEHRGFQAVKIK